MCVCLPLFQPSVRYKTTKMSWNFSVAGRDLYVCKYSSGSDSVIVMDVPTTRQWICIDREFVYRDVL